LLPPKKTHQNKGFTLIELLMVMAIIATLSAIAVPLYGEYIQRVKTTVAISDIKAIEGQLLLFETEVGRLPDSLVEAGIERTDPWGKPYQYIAIRGKPLTGAGRISPRMDRNLRPINSDYDLWSMGPDGQSQLALTAKASHDDVIRAGDGNFLGVAKGF
jgi:general secretion pathway protein G